MHATKAPVKTELQRRRSVVEPEQWPALRRELEERGTETQIVIDLARNAGGRQPRW